MDRITLYVNRFVIRHRLYTNKQEKMFPSKSGARLGSGIWNNRSVRDKGTKLRRRAIAALLGAAAIFSCLSTARAGLFSPRWTRAKPHYETRTGRRIAVAAGKAKDLNRALARAVAEERARTELLRLLQGKPPASNAEGLVPGARVAAVYESGRWVYVRLELDAGPASGP